MKLLLISNSTNSGEAYLEYPSHEIRNFLGSKTVPALFIPYAAVGVSYDDYTDKVKTRFNEIGHDIFSIHNFQDPVSAVKNAEAIVAGGGNTFMLITILHKLNLLKLLNEKITGGTPFIGWSAGANIACPTICTTNDMPIIQPPGFDALNLVPFQINPHYTDINIDGHAGETRQARIEEFLELNRNVWVTGLREGTMFSLENKNLQLIGSRPVKIFRYGRFPFEKEPGENLNFLLE